ncbi:MAG: diguanylate cyclase [Negativicutes bacterium]|nr:diguanylate cyclase [Negativicutes bacterium]
MKSASVRALTVKYIVALSLIAVLALAAFFTLRQLIVGEQMSAAVINTGGRQRMLIQKGVLLSFQLAVSFDPVERARLRAELQSNIKAMDEAHSAVIYSSTILGLEGGLSAEMQQVMFSPPVMLDAKMQRYFGALRALLALADNDFTIYIPQLPVVAAAADELLAAQEVAVNQLQRESETRVRRLERLETLVLGLTLLVLVLEAVFIFRPAAGVIAREQDALAAANQELELLSKQDRLTGIANRRHFDEFLDRMWRQATREATPIALLMADIDYFKRYNDTYGHQAGDDCLRKVARALESQAGRGTDLVARYGGEEFGVVLASTDLASALKVAEKLRATVAGLAIEHEGSDCGVVTISMGVASVIPRPGMEPPEIIALADIALYRAKETGRNCVVPDSGDYGSETGG